VLSAVAAEVHATEVFATTDVTPNVPHPVGERANLNCAGKPMEDIPDW